MLCGLLPGREGKGGGSPLKVVPSREGSPLKVVPTRKVPSQQSPLSTKSPLKEVPSWKRPLSGESPPRKVPSREAHSPPPRQNQGEGTHSQDTSRNPGGRGKETLPTLSPARKPTHTLDPIPGHPPPFPRKTGQAPPRARACSRCSLVYRCQIISFFIVLVLPQLLYPAVLLFFFL